jgi:hypothetical protein
MNTILVESVTMVNFKIMKNKFDLIDYFMVFAIIFFMLVGTLSVSAQVVNYDGELYDVVYSEEYEQPLQVTYKIMCPTGEISRSGMDFWKPKGYNGTRSSI